MTINPHRRPEPALQQPSATPLRPASTTAAAHLTRRIRRRSSHHRGPASASPPDQSAPKDSLSPEPATFDPGRDRRATKLIWRVNDSGERLAVSSASHMIGASPTAHRQLTRPRRSIHVELRQPEPLGSHASACRSERCTTAPGLSWLAPRATTQDPSLRGDMVKRFTQSGCRRDHARPVLENCCLRWSSHVTRALLWRTPAPCSRHRVGRAM